MSSTSVCQSRRDDPSIEALGSGSRNSGGVTSFSEEADDYNQLVAPRLLVALRFFLSINCSSLGFWQPKFIFTMHHDDCD